MKRKELTKTFLVILNWKRPIVFHENLSDMGSAAGGAQTPAIGGENWKKYCLITKFTIFGPFETVCFPNSGNSLNFSKFCKQSVFEILVTVCFPISGNGLFSNFPLKESYLFWQTPPDICKYNSLFTKYFTEPPVPPAHSESVRLSETEDLNVI